MNQSALDPHGPAAEQIGGLATALFWGGGLIFAVVMLLLAVAISRGWRRPAAVPLDHVHSRRLVVAGGLVVPAFILLAFVVGSVYVDRATSAPPPPHEALTLEITGHQWWWEVRYIDHRDQTMLITANEIHVPVGRPVRVRLRSNDVIHSFWVPNLQGKTDMIPGRTNVSWFQADRPGVYRGQCAEFCGLQHAFMAFVVVAVPPPEFEAWVARQREPAKPPTDPVRARGMAVFLTSSCALCHSIRGTPAAGRVAPDLTHFGSRRTLAAGRAPNTPGHLAGWIADPQSMKPGTRMPSTPMNGENLNAVVAYLRGLE